MPGAAKPQARDRLTNVGGPQATAPSLPASAQLPVVSRANWAEDSGCLFPPGFAESMLIWFRAATRQKGMVGGMIHVDVTMGGDVPGEAREHAEEKVGALDRFVDVPVLSARVVLVQEANPRIERSARAEGEFDLNGPLIRAKVADIDPIARRPRRAERWSGIFLAATGHGRNPRQARAGRCEGDNIGGRTSGNAPRPARDARSPL